MARAAGAVSSGAVASGAVASGAQESGTAATAGRLMAVARRVADHLVATFGGREVGLDGHPVIETALAELYRATGQRSYLDLAAQFVTQRRHGLAGDSGRGHRYLQDHMPIRDTRTEEGHAVRVMYLEAGVVDVAAETGDTALLVSSITRWEDMVATKTYLTGGNGSRHSDEAFGDRYELPPTAPTTNLCRHRQLPLELAAAAGHRAGPVRRPDGGPAVYGAAGGVGAGRCPAARGHRGALLPMGQPRRACDAGLAAGRRLTSVGAVRGVRPGSP